jgi:hypothetical protein
MRSWWHLEWMWRLWKQVADRLQHVRDRRADELWFATQGFGEYRPIDFAHWLPNMPRGHEDPLRVAPGYHR